MGPYLKLRFAWLIVSTMDELVRWAHSYIDEHLRQAMLASAYPPGTCVVVSCVCSAPHCIRARVGVWYVNKYNVDGNDYRITRESSLTGIQGQDAEYFPADTLKEWHIVASGVGCTFE